ncbi:hypothetical protein ACG7TL_004913 [Trametes sanguinea]
MARYGHPFHRLRLDDVRVPRALSIWRRVLITITITTIMLGVSLELPLTIRNTIPPSVLQGCLPRCPVETRGPDRHILFCPEALFPHRSPQVEVDEEGWEYIEPVGSSHMMEVIPRVGSFCQLVLPDNRRFTGRITRVLEYQQTRIILRVEHPYSPAIVTLAVPYPFYEGTRWWYIRLRRWFGYLTPDNDHHSTGKSIPCFRRSLSLMPTSGRAITKHRLVGA